MGSATLGLVEVGLISVAVGSVEVGLVAFMLVAVGLVAVGLVAVGLVRVSSAVEAFGLVAVTVGLVKSLCYRLLFKGVLTIIQMECGMLRK